MKKIEMKRAKKKAVTVSFRCPEDVFEAANIVIQRDDIDFSKLVRRALKNELKAA